jgi:hypothetical protein
VDLGEVLHEQVDVVQGIGALGVAGDLDDLVRGQVGVDLVPFLLDLAAEGGDLVPGAGLGGQGQDVDLLLEQGDGTLQLIEVFDDIHGFTGR